MNPFDQAIQFGSWNIPSLDGIVEIDRNFGGIEPPIAFSIELVRPANTHRNEGSPNLMSNNESPFLKRSDMPVQRSGSFGEDNHADAMLNVRSNVFQGLLKLRWATAKADGDVSETLHHPPVGWDLEVGVQFQTANELGDSGINDEGIENVDMIANENAGPLAVKTW